MTKIIRLLHPVHGLCAQEIIRHVYTEGKIKDTWKKKYGANMVGQCTTEIFEYGIIKPFHKID